jgi:uncharacterized membrane protein (UPF0182 family)
VLGAAGALATAGRLYAHLHTDWLWFHELGQDRVFWTMLLSRWGAGGLIGCATAAVLLVNFWLVDRAAPKPTPDPEPHPHPAHAAAPPTTLSLLLEPALRRPRVALLSLYAVAALAGGLLAGTVVGVAGWRDVVLWAHRHPFGVTDPVFHRDVGYFVFTLPLERRLSDWAFVLALTALATAVVGHVATGALRLAPRPRAGRHTRTHLLALGAAVVLIAAWRHQLSQFALELPRADGTMPGGYTDMHVQLLWLRGLVAVCLLAAIVLLASIPRRSWLPPAVALVVVAFAELGGPGPVTALVQRYLVEPQTLSRERPYLARQIQFTQLAYGLNDVEDRPLRADPTISDAELRAHRDVLDNVQLWDPAILQPDIDEHQSIGSFYSFPNVTVDRYRENGRLRMMVLAERELDLRRLEAEGRTWANDHLAYTHGYGLVAVPSGEVAPDGRPQLTNSGFTRGRSGTRLTEPRIYFGVQPPRAPPWIVTDTHRSEVEKPLDGTTPAPRDHYGGRGGFPLAGLVRRGLLALRFGEPNFLISETLGAGSRLLLHRDVRDRVRTLAPFLVWDDHPATVVLNGRITFLLSGSATTRWFPYARRSDVGGRPVNYLRDAALATVDAYSGQVTVYATGDDPIARAWRDVFPTLFTPADRMPAALRAHLRYPEKLFEAQSQVWATYHAADVDDFYTREDDWQRPADLSGPLDRVGSIRFRPRVDRPLDPEEPQDGEVPAPRMRPMPMLARLPGDRRPRFLLTMPYTAQGQENMTAFLAGSVDARGRPRLTQLSLPRSRLVLGPAQAVRRILAAPGVGDRLWLLNAETTDLGDRAVDAVQLGTPQVVPIGDGFMDVLPMYVTASGHGVTRLRLVSVYLNGRVGYGRTLDEAIARARGRATGEGSRGRPRTGRAAPSARR